MSTLTPERRAELEEELEDLACLVTLLQTTLPSLPPGPYRDRCQHIYDETRAEYHGRLCQLGPC